MLFVLLFFFLCIFMVLFGVIWIMLMKLFLNNFGYLLVFMMLLNIFMVECLLFLIIKWVFIVFSGVMVVFEIVLVIVLLINFFNEGFLILILSLSLFFFFLIIFFFFCLFKILNFLGDDMYFMNKLMYGNLKLLFFLLFIWFMEVNNLLIG